ncbi:MAG: hypothetical protein ACK2U0_16480 [Candidatus Promineifilaceae bacterium]|jgi:hypothetical protein
MKNAVLENGTQIAAQEEAPTEALCPLCGHPVSLRKRRLMNNHGIVYYWRHKSGGRLDCAGRWGYRSHG